MPRERIRFCFSIPDGVNAGLSCVGWRVWTNRDDIYITSKGLGGKWKVSLHGDDVWRMAATKEFIEAGGDFGITDRDAAKFEFEVVPMPADGKRMTFVILVPRSALISRPVPSKEICIPFEDRWDQCTKATVWTIEAGVDADFDPAQVVGGPLSLASGRQVWVEWGVERHDEVDPVPPPAGSMLAPLFPPRDDVACPGFVINGVNVE